MDAFRSLLLECLGDEMAGERFFPVLAAYHRRASRVARLLDCWRCEEHPMARRLTSCADEFCTTERIRALRRSCNALGEQYAQNLITASARGDRLGVFRALSPTIPQYIDKYTRLLEGAPVRWQGSLALLVAHERRTGTDHIEMLEGQTFPCAA